MIGPEKSPKIPTPYPVPKEPSIVLNYIIKISAIINNPSTNISIS